MTNSAVHFATHHIEKRHNVNVKQYGKHHSDTQKKKTHPQDSIVAKLRTIKRCIKQKGTGN
jgi:hypothetical protein